MAQQWDEIKMYMTLEVSTDQQAVIIESITKQICEERDRAHTLEGDAERWAERTIDLENQLKQQIAFTEKAEEAVKQLEQRLTNAEGRAAMAEAEVLNLKNMTVVH